MRRSAQAGVVLVAALALLAIVTVAAAAALYSARGSAVIAGSMRAQLSAREAAEAALLWCEAAIAGGRVTVQSAGLDDDPAQPSRWRSRANWDGDGALAAQVPGAPASAARAAQCLVEEAVLPRTRGADEGESTYVVTARGFSADHRRLARSDGSGAEVWLQSFVRMPTPAARGAAS